MLSFYLTTFMSQLFTFVVLITFHYYFILSLSLSISIVFEIIIDYKLNVTVFMDLYKFKLHLTNTYSIY